MQVRLIFPAVFLLLSSLTLCGQKVSYDGIPNAYEEIYISNIRCKANPSDSAIRTNIHIKHGMFYRIGDSIEVPAAAYHIKGDSLMAYAGWISMGTHDGIKKPKGESSQNSRPDLRNVPYHPGNPPAEVAGITPWVEVNGSLDLGNDPYKDYRNQGFAVLHVVPTGRMLPGQTTLVSTANGSLTETTIKTSAGMFGQFRGSGKGVFPATTIGVMAAFKDLTQNARQAAKHLDRYEMKPQGMPRPNYDEETLAFVPVVTQAQTLYFSCSETKEFFRLKELSTSLNLDPCILDFQYFHGDLAVIKSADIPLALSLKRPKEEKKSESLPGGLDSLEYDYLLNRKTEFADLWSHFPQKLDEAGIPYAFSMLDVSSGDVEESLGKLYESGSSEEQLLKALTTYPAALLGLDKVAGTVEEGKTAHLILTDNGIFEKESRVVYTIVDGDLYEVPEKKKSKKKGGSGDMSQILGVWNYTYTLEGETMNGTFTIEQQGRRIGGEASNPLFPVNPEITDVEFDGENFSFRAIADEEGFKASYYVDGKVADGKFKGKLSDEAGTFSVDFIAEQTSKPGK